MDLSDFFRGHPRAALAFSGGVDSAYLLWAAKHAGADVAPFYVKTPFQPQFELDDARRLATELRIKLRICEADPLTLSEIAANPPDRCYFCKRLIFGTIRAAAAAEGIDLLLDGTNASDDASDRPGMRALRELGVRSPLRECGLSKDEIRRRSREAGLFTWEKPAYACLATRIRSGEAITAEKLRKTEAAENCLFSLGFRDFRVRMTGNNAKLQLREADFPRLLVRKAEILAALRQFYDCVTLDLEARP